MKGRQDLFPLSFCINTTTRKAQSRFCCPMSLVPDQPLHPISRDPPAHLLEKHLSIGVSYNWKMRQREWLGNTQRTFGGKLIKYIHTYEYFIWVLFFIFNIPCFFFYKSNTYLLEKEKTSKAEEIRKHSWSHAPRPPLSTSFLVYIIPLILNTRVVVSVYQNGIILFFLFWHLLFLPM